MSFTLHHRQKHIIGYIQCGVGEEKLLSQAESHDSFERISISAHDRVRETGKGSWEKSEFDTGEGEGGDSNKLHTCSKFNVM